MSENRYRQYLPNTVRELREFQRLSEIEAPILEEEAAAKDRLIRNQWITTAERDGLLRLAKLPGIEGANAMETEQLRQELLYRWNLHSPYTYFHLLDWLDGFCGKEYYQAILEREKYRLRLILKLTIQEQKTFLEQYLRKIIPANIVLRVDLDLNTHGKLRALTHRQLKELHKNHAELPFADISPYLI